MKAKVQVTVSEADFDQATLATWLQTNGERHGAIVTFTGLVRDWATGGLTGLFIEHYPGMTERALTDVAEKVAAQWNVSAVNVVHRIGMLGLNAQIVFVGVAASHRKEAFNCAEQIMDYLKRDAPFWKKECAPSGDTWVEQKASDLEAAKRWQREEP